MMRKRQIPISWCMVFMFLMLTVYIPQSLAANSSPSPTNEIKNVILLIPDGMSAGGVALARWYQGGTPLAMDSMACGAVRTYSSDAPIADSAPAGTAYATGFKSHTGYVGVLPDTADMPGQNPLAKADRKKPVATILEAARLAGKSTGLVATCEIMHATPADFSAHYPDRKNYDVLSEQQVYNNMDVVLGGGSKYLQADQRKDKEDLIQVIKGLGYEYVTKPEELSKSKAPRIWGMFAPVDLSYDLDRNPQAEPSLAAMTNKAIQVLSGNPQGFFLMVEGSKIDWAAHANDPVGVVSDILAFDRAVRTALNFAEKDGHTVVIAVADHGTGGITIGDSTLSKGYDTASLSTFIDPLKKASLTGEGIERLLSKNGTPNPKKNISNTTRMMADYYGVGNFNADETLSLQNYKVGELNYVTGPIISKRAHIGWTTNGHTGEDVGLYVYSPNNDRPTGVIDNTEVARYMERVLGLNLNSASKTLFVPAFQAFAAKGAKAELDNRDPANPVLIVTRDIYHLSLPINKNQALLNGKTVVMNGLTVSNEENVYVPREAIDLLP